MHSQRKLRETSEEERKFEVQQGSRQYQMQDMPISPDSDPRVRRVMKAATAAASGSSSQMEGSRAVAETPTPAKVDGRRVKDGRRGRRERRIQKSDSTEHQTTNYDKKTSLEENESDETLVAVTTQESLVGISHEDCKPP